MNYCRSCRTIQQSYAIIKFNGLSFTPSQPQKPDSLALQQTTFSALTTSVDTNQPSALDLQKKSTSLPLTWQQLAEQTRHHVQLPVTWVWVFQPCDTDNPCFLEQDKNRNRYIDHRRGPQDEFRAGFGGVGGPEEGQGDAAAASVRHRPAR